MCHLTIAVDQAVHPIQPVIGALEESPFYIRSIRVVPVAWSSKAEVHLSLGGGSSVDLLVLLRRLRRLPAVLATEHVMPLV